jgi:Lar family restriction alleviation protein
MGNNLKSCPFCGEIKDLLVSEFNVRILGGKENDFYEDEGKRVQCLNCGALGADGFTKEHAIKCWNERKRSHP